VRDDEVAAAIREVRERVQARNGAHLALPDLMPLIHARDAAEAKVGAIGTVNPRPPGLKNSLIQWVKRKIARALDWHVREQIEFNRSVMDALQATLEALTETNQVLASLAATLGPEQREARDIHTLRAIADLQNASQLRAAQLEQSFHEVTQRQHRDFTAASEKLIHSELRLIRQRSAIAPSAIEAVPLAAQPLAGLDVLRFSEHFRGPEDRVREHQRRYIARFHGATNILDLGCGRGEFLEAARDAGLTASGIDANAEFVALCRSKGLDAQAADLFTHLASLPDGSLRGAFCSHVVEHLAPVNLPGLIHLLARKLEANAPLVIETPSPANPHFYLDPTHTHPVPAELLRFYLVEAGFGAIEVEYLSEGLDFAMFARKL
jgi:SAM-dependent methyltransferase